MLTGSADGWITEGYKLLTCKTGSTGPSSKE
jgi:hypothetical protein